MASTDADFSADDSAVVEEKALDEISRKKGKNETGI
tara:strand:- start:316 stop:423 length:108 start_codon:yes stop_codon:yes gene_type:complete